MVSGVENNNSLSNALGSVAGSSSQFVSENTFLTLLITQLENQDPMNPQDSSQFVSQLASFSSLEQMTAMNTNMQNVLDNSATSLINQQRDAVGSKRKHGSGNGYRYCLLFEHSGSPGQRPKLSFIGYSKRWQCGSDRTVAAGFVSWPGSFGSLKGR